MLRTHMEPYEVSKEQLEFFHENGFLLLKKVWNKEDIDVIRKDLDEAAKDNFTVRLDMHFHKSIKLAHRSKKMCDIGDAICNGRAIPLASTTFFCKPNNPKEYGSIWHQDNFAPMAPNGDNYLNLAIIVDDADKSNGSLVIIPGSHKLGMLSFKPTPNFSYDADGNLVQSAPIGDAKKLSDYTDSTGNNLPDDLPKLQLEYEAGDILVIHGLLLHKADKNPHPSKWRRTIYSVYIKENEPFWPGWTAKRQLLNRYDSPEKVKKQMSCFKFGYTHINKCAGTSVHHWLTANNLLATYGTSGDHLVRSSADLLSFDPKIVNIITVRNPYNRIYSIFKQWEKMDG